MTKLEKIEYISKLEEYHLRFACCHLRCELDALQEYILSLHCLLKIIGYKIRKGWFSWSNFTKNDWSK